MYIKKKHDSQRRLTNLFTLQNFFKSNAEQNCILCEPALVHEPELTFDQYNYNTTIT